jgi:hypothetical protein
MKLAEEKWVDQREYGHYNTHEDGKKPQFGLHLVATVSDAFTALYQLLIFEMGRHSLYNCS